MGGQVMANGVLLMLMVTSRWIFTSATVPGYVDSPGVVRIYIDEPATFIWRLNVSLNDVSWRSTQFDYLHISEVTAFYIQTYGALPVWKYDYQSRTTIIHGSNNQTLGFSLTDVTETDTRDRYWCSIRARTDGENVDFSDTNAQLFIYGLPTTPTLTPAPPDAVENTELSLTCSTTTTSVPAGLLPVMTYTWTRDGGPLPADRHSTRGDHGQELVIDTVQREDHQKVYRCQVRETGSKLSNSNQLTLDVQYVPIGISLSDPGPITAVEGDHVTVTCTSDCRPGCDYVWAGPGGYRHEGSNLSFQSINRDRHGTYTCQSSNDHGSQSAELSVTVNFAPAITSFGHSQGDISGGDDVTLTCSVDSRPDSVIQISISTSELDPTIRGNTAEYRFHKPVTVLDSGSYFCSASNGIEPNPDDHQLTLDIKGGFFPCNNQSVTETRGAALNDAFEEPICLIANPFPVIMRDDWMLAPSNGTRSDVMLPDDVTITMETTLHLYQNIIVFRIPSVSVSHYGTCTMTADNGEAQALVFTLLITPDGPPEAPTNLRCTDTTAVSLHLQWHAGHDGGADQTFVLTYTDIESGTASVVEIDGSGTPRGALVSHKLADTQHILPDTTYLIQLDSRNKNGKTGGSAITNSTLAEPGFDGDPAIVIETDTALVTWPISNPESLTHIIVNVCDSDKAIICNVTTVSDVSIQPYIVALPDASSFQFTFDMYDGENLVNTIVYSHDTDEPEAHISSTIIGAVIGVIVAVVVAVVVILILWRKGILYKLKKNNNQDASVHYENAAAANIDGREIPEGKKVDVQYEDVDVLTADISKTTDKVYEGLITEEIHKVPTVYTTVGADQVSVTKYHSSDIRPGDVISRGAVFCVQAAVILRGKHNQEARNVVLKQSVSSSANVYIRYLFETAKLLRGLSDCQYVVHCAGMTANSLLMENVPLGNLRQYLRGISDHTYSNTADVIQQECLGFVRQIINGLEVICSSKSAALSYCLSSDHVLLGEGKICKLTGFNTAESVRQREQWESGHRLSRPVRWLAPEAIDLRHVAESEIWAFGVLVWDILNFGLQPYPDMEDSQIMDFVKRGHRHLEMPPSTKAEICDVVNHCWTLVPSKRPTLKQTSDVVNEVLRP